MDPIPVETQLSFESSLSFTGMTKEEFEADNATQLAVRTTFANSMKNTTAEDVTIVNCSVVSSSRRLSDTVVDRKTLKAGSSATGDVFSGDVHSLLRTRSLVVLNGLQVTMAVQIILEELGFTVAESATVYDDMSHDLNEKVSTGAFATELAVELVVFSGTSSLVVDNSSLVVSNFTVTVVDTPNPTLEPVVSPSNDGELNSSQVTIIAVVVPITVIGIMLAVAYVFTSGRHQLKSRSKAYDAEGELHVTTVQANSSCEVVL